MARIIVIGDVHGCLEEMEELLEALDLSKDDTIISLGDLLHKGPYSAGVVETFARINPISNILYPKRILIAGNHEEKHLRWLDHELKGTKPNPVDHTEEFPGIQSVLDEDPDNVELLRAAHLSLTITVNSHRYHLVHAGVPSTFNKSFYPSSMTMRELASKSGKERKTLAQVLRLRYEDPNGHMVPLGQEKEEDTYWADRYDGRFGTILFGHQPFFTSGPRYFPHAIGLDTGCVHGGHLTAYILEEGKEPTYIAIKAKQVYVPRGLFMLRRPE